MKLKYIATFAIVLFVTALTTNAQSVSMRIGSVAVDPSDVVEVHVPNLGGGPNVRAFEGSIDASSEEGCMASRDFTNFRPVSPDRGKIYYAAEAGIYRIEWTVPKSLADRCRVLIVGETPASADYAIWRMNFGQTAFTRETSGIDAFGIQYSSPSWGLDRIDQR